MEKMLHNLKHHPYVVAGGVFVIGVVLIVILFGGSKSGTAPTVSQATTDTSGATQLAMAQLQAQAASHASDNALAASTNLTSAQLQAAQTTAAASVNMDAIQYGSQVQLAQIKAGSDNQIATLQANVAQSQIGANLSAALNHDNDALQLGENANSAQITIAGLAEQLGIHTVDQQTYATVAQSNNALELGIQQSQADLAKSAFATNALVQLGQQQQQLGNQVSQADLAKTAFGDNLSGYLGALTSNNQLAAVYH